MRRRSARAEWWRATYVGLALVALANAGCLVVAAGACAGAAGYAYCKGKVCENYIADFNDTWAASHTALTELAMPVTAEERSGPGDGSIESRTADGERVRILVSRGASRIPSEGTITTVGVRVATFGDYTLSDRILYQIGAHLRVAPAPGEPAASQPMPTTLGPIQPASVPPQTAAPPLLPPEPVPVKKP